jgi:hypothetical protein
MPCPAYNFFEIEKHTIKHFNTAKNRYEVQKKYFNIIYKGGGDHV